VLSSDVLVVFFAMCNSS